jgi:hypothetical protein
VLPVLLRLLILIAAVIGLPFFGALLGREPLSQFLHLPLRERAWDPLPLDLAVFWAGLVATSGLLMVLVWLAWPRSRPSTPPAAVPPARFPRWGWLGAPIALVATGLGSTGIGLPILFVGLSVLWSADTQRRSGPSLLTRRPVYFAVLFPVSAIFGWLYYYLNLYLQLWTYPAAGSPAGFALTQTAEYATLLPTLLSLRQWLGSFPLVLGACSRGHALRADGGPATGWALIGLACFGLAGAGLWRDWIYPLTWVAPLLLALGIQGVRNRPSPFAGIASGDWSRALLTAFSALCLGVIAQAWNHLAGPFWVYSLPAIDAARLLDLPILAYVGLLPLGLLGIWLADQLALPWRRHPLGRFPKFPIRIVVKP